MRNDVRCACEVTVRVDVVSIRWDTRSQQTLMMRGIRSTLRKSYLCALSQSGQHANVFSRRILSGVLPVHLAVLLGLPDLQLCLDLLRAGEGVLEFGRQ
jgi:hypothetical protein